MVLRRSRPLWPLRILLLLALLLVVLLLGPHLQHQEHPILTAVLAQSQSSSNATATVVFPPLALGYHVQGGVAQPAHIPQFSPDGRFLCRAVGAAVRGMSLHCWRMAPANSSTSLALRTGVLDAGAVIRASLPLPGSNNLLKDWRFSLDGRAVVATFAAPTRVWQWDRDVESGALSGLRVLYTLTEATNSFAPFFQRVVALNAATTLAFARSDVWVIRSIAPPPSSSAPPSMEAFRLEADDVQVPPSQVTILLPSSDGRCIYAGHSGVSGLGFWRVRGNATATGRLGPFVPVPPGEAGVAYPIAYLSLASDADQRSLLVLNSHSVALFARDPVSCNLTLLAFAAWDITPALGRPAYLGSGTALPGRNDTWLLGCGQGEAADPGCLFKLIRLERRSDEELQAARDAKAGGATVTFDQLLPYKLREVGFVPMIPGALRISMPVFSRIVDAEGAPRHVLVLSEGAELYSVQWSAFLRRMTLDPAQLGQAWGWIDASDVLPAGAEIEQVQTGLLSDLAFVVATSDARFLYSSGGASDMHRYALSPSTGRRVDGGRRFFTNESIGVDRGRFYSPPSLPVAEKFSSLALSADAGQRFIYGAGRELHAMIRDLDTGAIVNRSVYPGGPQGDTGNYGTPVARNDPLPHLFVPDGLLLHRFRTDVLTGEILLPDSEQGDPPNGVVFNLPPELLGITALVVDYSAVYIGGGERSVTVVARSPVLGTLSPLPMQVEKASGAAVTTRVVALLLAGKFLYTFDNLGSLVVYTRGADGGPTANALTQLQSAPAALTVGAGSAVGFTPAVHLWENSRQSLLLVGLQTGNLVVYRRNVVSGLVDSPRSLAPPGQPASLWNSQGAILSVVAVQGTLYATAQNVKNVVAAVLMELHTDNAVLPGETGNGTASGPTTEEERWAAQWGIDWEPAMRLQVSMPGYPLDGSFVSYRPDMHSNPFFASQLRGCGWTTGIALPVPVELVISTATADGCFVPKTQAGVGTVCASRLVQSGGCDTNTKLTGAKNSGSKFVLVAATSSVTSALEAADPGRWDNFELPSAPAANGSSSAVHFAAEVNPFGTLLVHVEAADAALLRSAQASCGGQLGCAGKATLVHFAQLQENITTNASAALWRMAAATSWSDERIGLRQFLPQPLRGEIPPPTTGVASADLTLNFNVPMPEVCRSWVPGVWCENGVVSISWVGWQGMLGNGSVPDMWADLAPTLQSLRLVDSPITGTLPPSFCLLRRLRYLHIERSLLTALPDCFGPEHMPTLEHFHVSESRITRMPPSLARAKRLQWLNFAHNWAPNVAKKVSPSSLPDLSGLDKLVLLNISSSRLQADVSLLRCASWSQLNVYAVDGNALSGVLTPDWFDGLAQLRRVSLAGNALQGPLPVFHGANNLVSLSLANCGLTGAFPAEWGELTLLTHLDVSGNSLTLPLSPLVGLTSLSFLDLSKNLLECPDGLLDPLLRSLPVSLQTLRLDGNPLRDCAWSSAVASLQNSPLLQALTASRTGLTALPEDLFAPVLPWRSLDFSFCALRVGLSDRYAPSSLLLSLTLAGNLNLAPRARPSWLRLDPSVLLQVAGQLFTCPTPSIAANPAAILRLPASVTDYEQCACVPGTFGTAPACQLQISEVPLYESMFLNASDAGWLHQQHALLPPLTASAEQQLIALTSASVSSALEATDSDLSRFRGLATPPPSPVLAQSAVSDAWFGSARATPGVNTDYVITAPAGTRVLRVIVLVNRDEFVGRSDVLTVRSNGNGNGDGATGDAQVLLGDAVALPTIHICADSASGVDATAATRATLLLRSAVLGAPLQDSSAYVASLEASLSSLCNLSVWAVDVYGTSATLNFRSNNVRGAHFVASWVSSPFCPEGLEPDPHSTACFGRYQVDTAVQSAVLALAAGLAGLLLVIGGLLLWHRRSAVIRAASLRLQLFLLLCMLSLCAGAVLHTVLPRTVSDDAPCVARAWLTLMPMSLILSALFARASHVTAIFASQSLRAVGRTTHLARWLLGATAVELALLLAFTLLPLSGAVLREQHSLPGQLILECGGRDGFWPWMGVQLAFLLLLLIPSVSVAFRARKLPILFNESSSLFNGLLMLSLCAITVLPAAAGVSGTAVPEAAQAVAAFGQLMLVALWSVTLFAPRLLLLVRVSTHLSTPAASLSITTGRQLHTQVAESDQSPAAPAADSANRVMMLRTAIDASVTSKASLKKPSPIQTARRIVSHPVTLLQQQQEADTHIWPVMSQKQAKSQSQQPQSQLHNAKYLPGCAAISSFFSPSTTGTLALLTPLPSIFAHPTAHPTSSPPPPPATVRLHIDELNLAGAANSTSLALSAVDERASASERSSIAQHSGGSSAQRAPADVQAVAPQDPQAQMPTPLSSFRIGADQLELHRTSVLEPLARSLQHYAVDWLSVVQSLTSADRQQSDASVPLSLSAEQCSVMSPRIRKKVFRSAASYLCGVDAAISAALSGYAMPAPLPRPAIVSSSAAAAAADSVTSSTLSTPASSASVFTASAPELSLRALSVSPVQSSAALSNWILTWEVLRGVLQTHQWSPAPGVGFAPLVRQFTSLADEAAAAERAERRSADISPSSSLSASDGANIAAALLASTLLEFVLQLQAELTDALEQALSDGSGGAARPSPLAVPEPSASPAADTGSGRADQGSTASTASSPDDSPGLQQPSPSASPSHGATPDRV